MVGLFESLYSSKSRLSKAIAAAGCRCASNDNVARMVRNNRSYRALRPFLSKARQVSIGDRMVRRPSAGSREPRMGPALSSGMIAILIDCELIPSARAKSDTEAALSRSRRRVCW